MVRRSERKMQPRGFFRPKFRSSGKQAKSKTARVTAASAKPAAMGEQKVVTSPPSVPAKTAALPAGSVVRQRHKAPEGKVPTNGTSAKAPAALALASKPADTTGSPKPTAPSRVTPTPMPALPPELLQNIERTSGAAPRTQRPPSAGNGQAVPTSPPASERAAIRGADKPLPNIVAPLSEALARAANTNPTTGRPTPPDAQQHKGKPATPGDKPPPLNGASSPPPANESSQQPDFSTLPPSIAASLARLASGDPLQKSEGTQPRKESKIASKG
jgi:hypothetical protein